MKRIICVLTKDSVRWVLRAIGEWSSSLGGRVLNETLLAVIVTDNDGKECIYPQFQNQPQGDTWWRPVEAFDVENVVQQIETFAEKEQNRADKEKTSLGSAANALHQLADTLPYTGSLVDVVAADLNGDTDASTFVEYLGALRRLVDWHNAVVTVIPLSSIGYESSTLLTTFLHAPIADSPSKLHIHHDVLWRGRVSVTNKIECQGLLFPKFKIELDTSDERHRGYNQSTSLDKNMGQPCLSSVLGRVIEVVDEVAVDSVPTFMWTGDVYQLSLYHSNLRSDSLIQYIKENKQTGLVARLPCYHLDLRVPLCGELNLNTASWKESIRQDIHGTHELEEEILEPPDFLYFLITTDNDHVVAHQLQSPQQLNGAIFQQLHHHAMLPSQPGHPEDVDRFVDGLPELSWEQLEAVQSHVCNMQISILKEWIDQRNSQGQSTAVTFDQLYTFLCDVQQIVMETVKSELPTVHLPDIGGLRPVLPISELSTNPADWPERLVLAFQESEKRALSRLQSTESLLALSSPIQPDNVSNSIEVQDFLKMFHADGSAKAEGLSPIRPPRHRNRAYSGCKIFSQGDNQTATVSWPECRDLQFHDVYYNRDKKSEKMEQHHSKIRDRCVREETNTSCSSPVFVLTKPTQGKKGKPKITSPIKQNFKSVLSPRRSPRKKVTRILDEDSFSSRSLAQKKIAVSNSQPVPESRVQQPQRRGSENLNTRLSDPKFVSPKQISVLKQQQSRRNSVPCLSSKQEETRHLKAIQTSTPIPRTRKSDLKPRPHSESLVSDSQASQPSASQSRSQRHKEKLEQIVNGVLQEYGLTPDDELYPSCATKLYKVTKLFVMDLPTSQNLRQEMKKIASGQVQQVVELETRRQSTRTRSRSQTGSQT